MRVTYYLVAGFPLTVRDYYQRTRRLLDNIDDLAREVLPANRDIVNRFTGSYVVLTVHAFMAGIWGCPVDPPPSGLFERFEEYVETEERSMFTVLSELKYNLDASNTVNMVLGTHHPEKVRWPRYEKPVTHLAIAAITSDLPRPLTSRLSDCQPRPNRAPTRGRVEHHRKFVGKSHR